MVDSLADDFAAEVAQLCSIEVALEQWEKFLDVQVPRQHPVTGQPLRQGR